MGTELTFVAAFVAATGQAAPGETFALGDQPARADELAQLVLAGRKRATAALFADLGHRQDQLPQALALRRTGGLGG